MLAPAARRLDELSLRYIISCSPIGDFFRLRSPPGTAFTTTIDETGPHWRENAATQPPQTMSLQAFFTSQLLARHAKRIAEDASIWILGARAAADIANELMLCRHAVN